MKRSHLPYTIVAIEPDSVQFSRLKKYFDNNKEIKLYNIGLYCETTKLHFKIIEGGSSQITNEVANQIEIDVKSIDEINECNRCTFIKMDIEGAEMEALIGARNTIISLKPKLAICIYHSDEDMLRIIEYVHKLVPEYRIYIRHYSRTHTETVMYAVI